MALLSTASKAVAPQLPLQLGASHRQRSVSAKGVVPRSRGAVLCLARREANVTAEVGKPVAGSEHSGASAAIAAAAFYLMTEAPAAASDFDVSPLVGLFNMNTLILFGLPLVIFYQIISIIAETTNPAVKAEKMRRQNFETWEMLSEIDYSKPKEIRKPSYAQEDAAASAKDESKEA
mmetsp:Transcript_12447/g.45386  ORF Transcript_12447/g.45386 Transcript_12447/m.45386 type:complete len:177 (-) Transcript_12447:1856-2386(-)